MSNEAKFDPDRIKHLEMIQAIVTRLAGNSFLIKGWAITLSVALVGFGVSKSDPDLALVSFVPTLVFWALDTYYLRSERLFRALYERIRKDSDAVEPFFMGATGNTFVASVDKETRSWLRTACRATLAGFYGPLIIATGLITAAIC